MFSILLSPRFAIPFAATVLVVSSIGGLALLGELTPAGRAMTNYMVFIHSAAGPLVGQTLRVERDEQM